MDQNKQSIHIVYLTRTDRREKIELGAFNTQKQALEVLNAASAEWYESTSEKRPFRMDVPYMTHFLPNLIVEIEISEMDELEYQRLNSPLDKQLKEMGTTGFMGKHFDGQR